MTKEKPRYYRTIDPLGGKYFFEKSVKEEIKNISEWQQLIQKRKSEFRSLLFNGILPRPLEKFSSFSGLMYLYFVAVEKNVNIADINRLMNSYSIRNKSCANEVIATLFHFRNFTGVPKNEGVEITPLLLWDFAMACHELGSSFINSAALVPYKSGTPDGQFKRSVNHNFSKIEDLFSNVRDRSICKDDFEKFEILKLVAMLEELHLRTVLNNLPALYDECKSAVAEMYEERPRGTDGNVEYAIHLIADKLKEKWFNDVGTGGILEKEENTKSFRVGVSLSEEIQQARAKIEEQNENLKQDK